MIMIRLLFFLFLTFLNLFPAIAQQTLQRPKVGLVLSGGGAKGLAHIGVLRSMEKAGLTPDYITGTSMGSIVGGLYAIGYSADEIDSIVATVNWDEVLTNEIPLSNIAIEEKKYYGRYIAELPIEGVKVGLPKGLIEGQKLTELLTRLTRPAHGINDFHKLPIPYACVAADIATGLPVVLDNGFLPEAIRASMSIPTIFTPVEIDDKLLVDGGLVRNFPVEEVLEMGADIVIGVFVSSDLESKEKLDNLISVLSQAAFVTSAFDTRKQRTMVDIYVEPDLKEYHTASFDKAKEIVERGDDAGEEFYETFKHLADSLRQFGPLWEVKKLPLKEMYHISKISIEGNKRIPAKVITGRLRIKENSDLSIDEIEKQISLLYGTRHYQKVTYQILTDGDGGGYELKVKVTEAPDGHLKLAVHYDSENDVGVNANLTYRDLILPSSRLVLEFDLAKDPRVDFNFLKYIGKRRNAGIIAGVFYQNAVVPYYEKNTKLGLLNANNTDLYITFQSMSSQKFTFGAKLLLEYSKLKPDIGDFGKDIAKIKNRDFSGVLFFNYNSLDRQFYPKKGTDFYVSLKQVFSVDNTVLISPNDSLPDSYTPDIDPFIAFEIRFNHLFKVSKWFSIIWQNSMAITSLPDFNTNVNDFYFLGGFNPRYKNISPFWGAQDKQYVAPNYFYTNLALQFEVFGSLYLTGLINYIDVQYPMTYIANIAVDNYLDGERRRFGYGFSIGYNSPFGPMIFSLASDPNESKVITNFSLGYWF